MRNHTDWLMFVLDSLYFTITMVTQSELSVNAQDEITIHKPAMFLCNVYSLSLLYLK